MSAAVFRYLLGLPVVALFAAYGWLLVLRLLRGTSLGIVEDLGLGRASVAVVALGLQAPLAVYLWVGLSTGALQHALVGSR